MTKKIKMFKPGKHVASDGNTYAFSEADLEASAAAYNPELHAAPMVIGHPKHDAPAYGRITAAEFGEGFLLGEPSKVDPAFAEAVNKGQFDRVSLSFYAPDSPANPVPGVYYPRHLGFLGSVPPGCKGLGAVSFGESEQGVLNFGDWNDRTIARVLRRIKNAWIEKFGKDEADQLIDEWDLESLQEEAMRPEAQPEPLQTDTIDTAFAEATAGNNVIADPAREEHGMMTPEQLAAKEADLEKREEALKKQIITAAHASNMAFAEGLVKEGRMLPAQKDRVVAVLDFASSFEESAISFGEGDGKESKPATDLLRAVFAGYPKLIEFGELAAGDLPDGEIAKPQPCLTDRV